MEFVQLFQHVPYMVVNNKNETDQLGPLLLARCTGNGRGEPMHAVVMAIGRVVARVVVISDSIRSGRKQGKKGALY